LENLWTLKAILRGFETASGLKVNFWKSGLIGVNVALSFLEIATTFLNCRLGSIPFIYLGLPIGANPRSDSTWDPLLDHLRKRLFSWRNKHISLGGRIVMINAVLNAIPIFYLSFLKIPIKVWKKIVRIQREFLWGGVKGGRKISWVKWSVVCREKCKGGLGVRDIRIVNLSLLAKWRWRLLLPGRPLWKDILVAKYGSHILGEVDWSSYRIPTFASSWWKSIVAVENTIPGKNWWLESVSRKVGNRMDTSFWKTKWLGDLSLVEAFPRLFSLSNHKDDVVSNFLVREGDDCSWAFSWRRNLFRWEEELVGGLLELLEVFRPSLEEDVWKWLPCEEGEFSVKSSYLLLSAGLDSDDEGDEVVLNALGQIWSSPAPSKTIAFSWQLLYNRVPTRSNLEVRGVLSLDLPWECLGCVGHVETPLHLFLHCPSIMKVWLEVFKWLGFSVPIPPSLVSLFDLLKGVARNSRLWKGYLMIWHASLWSIWRARNRAIFASGIFSPLEIIEEIKVLSWKWCLARLKVAPCLYYEWIWDPGDCLMR
jgi:hypothetical protein